MQRVYFMCLMIMIFFLHLYILLMQNNTWYMALTCYTLHGEDLHVHTVIRLCLLFCPILLLQNKIDNELV